jgi:hypothetical protein
MSIDNDREFIQLLQQIVFRREEQVRQRDKRIRNLLAILARERCRVHIGKHRKSAEHASD